MKYGAGAIGGAAGLWRAITVTVAVKYDTANGTGQAGSDYVAKSDLLTPPRLGSLLRR